MSVLIKGMEMPNNCADCGIEHEEENYYGETLGFRCPLIYKGYIHDRTGRLPECPLVEIKSPFDYQRYVDSVIREIIGEEVEE